MYARIPHELKIDDFKNLFAILILLVQVFAKYYLPASVVNVVAYVQQHQVLPIAFHNMYSVVEPHNPSFVP